MFPSKVNWFLLILKKMLCGVFSMKVLKVNIRTQNITEDCYSSQRLWEKRAQKEEGRAGTREPSEPSFTRSQLSTRRFQN